MKITNLIGILLSLAMLSSCATIFGDNSDKITIHSKYPDAAILVNGNQVGTGSAVYDLPRGKTAVLTATKSGCSDISMSTDQTLAGITFVNLIFWPGYLIDAASGAIHKAGTLDYMLTPKCNK
jgi:hypothetical protein